MIQFLIGIVIVFGSFIQTEQETKQDQVDFTNPESVVNAIFDAAREQDFTILSLLCDPEGEGDGDVKQICSVTGLAEEVQKNPADKNLKRDLEDFVSVFKKGKITGETTYKTFKDIEYASVPFCFDHPGGDDRSNETMELVKRMDKWYLYSF